MCGSRAVWLTKYPNSPLQIGTESSFILGLFGCLRRTFEYVAFSETLVTVAKLNWKSFWIVLLTGHSVPFSRVLYLALSCGAVGALSRLNLTFTSVLEAFLKNIGERLEATVWH